MRDAQYYSILKDIRFENITNTTWQLLNKKFQNNSNDLLLEKVLNTTHVIGYKETAEQINTQICNTLPVENEKYLISYSKDIINGKEQQHGTADYLMKHKTNFQAL